VAIDDSRCKLLILRGQLIRNQQVPGSSPGAGSMKTKDLPLIYKLNNSQLLIFGSKPVPTGRLSKGKRLPGGKQSMLNSHYQFRRKVSLNFRTYLSHFR